MQAFAAHRLRGGDEEEYPDDGEEESASACGAWFSGDRIERPCSAPPGLGFLPFGPGGESDSYRAWGAPPDRPRSAPPGDGEKEEERPGGGEGDGVLDGVAATSISSRGSRHGAIGPGRTGGGKAAASNVTRRISEPRGQRLFPFQELHEEEGLGDQDADEGKSDRPGTLASIQAAKTAHLIDSSYLAERRCTSPLIQGPLSTHFEPAHLQQSPGPTTPPVGFGSPGPSYREEGPQLLHPGAVRVFDPIDRSISAPPALDPGACLLALQASYLGIPTPDIRCDESYDDFYMMHFEENVNLPPPLEPSAELARARAKSGTQSEIEASRGHSSEAGEPDLGGASEAACVGSGLSTMPGGFADHGAIPLGHTPALHPGGCAPRSPSPPWETSANLAAQQVQALRQQQQNHHHHQQQAMAAATIGAQHTQQGLPLSSPPSNSLGFGPTMPSFMDFQGGCASRPPSLPWESSANNVAAQHHLQAMRQQQQAMAAAAALAAQQCQQQLQQKQGLPLTSTPGHLGISLPLSDASRWTNAAAAATVANACAAAGGYPNANQAAAFVAALRNGAGCVPVTSVPALLGGGYTLGAGFSAPSGSMPWHQATVPFGVSGMAPAGMGSGISQGQGLGQPVTALNLQATIPQGPNNYAVSGSGNASEAAAAPTSQKTRRKVNKSLPSDGKRPLGVDGGGATGSGSLAGASGFSACCGGGGPPTGTSVTAGTTEGGESDRRPARGFKLAYLEDLFNTNQFIHNVFAIARDQAGCRMLQHKLDEGNAEVASAIFSEVLAHCVDLMMDPFGNYLCQKLMDMCNAKQLELILDRVCGALVRISLNMHGARAVQKMIDAMPGMPKNVQRLVNALSGSVVVLTKDPNGNHVIQRCLESLPADSRGFIHTAVAKDIVEVASHSHGCRIVQRCIDAAAGSDRDMLMSAICSSSLVLVQDPFGNYVVQYILQLNDARVNSAILRSMLGHLNMLSRQKFSSNVVEKLLTACSKEDTERMIMELYDARGLGELLRDVYGNYVVQRALAIAEEPLLSIFLAAVRPLLTSLRSTGQGRRIAQKLEKKYPQLRFGAGGASGASGGGAAGGGGGGGGSRRGGAGRSGGGALGAGRPRGD